jgi:hypothetical protein
MKNYTEMEPGWAAGPSFDEHEIGLPFLAQAQCIFYLPRSLRSWIMRRKTGAANGVLGAQCRS